MENSIKLSTQFLLGRSEGKDKTIVTALPGACADKHNLRLKTILNLTSEIRPHPSDIVTENGYSWRCLARRRAPPLCYPNSILQRPQGTAVTDQHAVVPQAILYESFGNECVSDLPCASMPWKDGRTDRQGECPFAKMLD